jgi:hypothetical protein
VPRAAVLEEGRLGRERYGVRGTPTLMLGDGTKLRAPIAFARMRERKVVGVQALAMLRRSLHGGDARLV